jgi:hypothetical protein
MTQNLSLPALYDRMIECGVIDLEPWALLRGSEVARWTGGSVVVLDDFDVVRDAGGEAVRRAISEYASMDEWLIAVVRDFIEFD